MADTKAINVSTEEARLLAVFRAIRDFGNPDLIDYNDVGTATGLLEVVGDLVNKEKNLSETELRQFVAGFVAGLAAANIRTHAPLNVDPNDVDFIEQEEEEVQPVRFTGGPSGGVALGQGKDPSLVTQSGVQNTEQ